MRFLCVSDIHGHARELDAILEEADGYGWDQLVACGDLVFPGPEPLKVWKTLVRHRALCVQGVSDRALSQIDPSKLLATTEHERERIERFRQIQGELGELIITRLGKLPTIARLPLESGHTLMVVHGSPLDPTECFTMDMTEDELIALLGDEPGDVIVCGGSHAQFERRVADVQIISVGSVGQAPGGGYAQATIVATGATGIQVTPLSVNLPELPKYS
ncbi:MAG TPA: metallophosphoesterase family protein [Polyangiaceae bacterium]|nr:metallophosphoesterase family protein [Polyangiaceae bacterium]